MTLSQRIIRLFASRAFFGGTLIFFAVQAIWMALTAVYPMAFDENFHLGIIQVYATKWSPFLSDVDQPDTPGPLGELIHDPSYLFHYLMSFPYRLVDGLWHNQVADIIVLRLIGVGLFIGGLVLFRKLLLAIGASRALAHVAIFLTVMIPITPFLAGQINYDNLIFLLTPFFLLVTIRIIQRLRSDHTFHFRQLAAWVSTGLLASLTKYAFLPVVAASGLAILYIWWRSGHVRHAWHSLGRSYLQLSLIAKVGLIACITLSLGLFGQRYVYNLATYHSIQPDCADVLTVDQCKLYGPWGRDYGYKQIKLSNAVHVDPNPITYLANWVSGMVYRLYFTINTDYATKDPLPLPLITGVAMCDVGLVLFVVFIRRILRRYPFVWLILATAALYILSLIIVEYQSYLHTNVYVAINGRYLLPLMPLLILLVGFGWQAGIGALPARWHSLLKAWLTVPVLLLTLNGGGIVSYVYFAEPAGWYWPHDPLTGVNEWLQRLIRPLIIR